jgi:anti-sigma factor RsiW
VNCEKLETVAIEYLDGALQAVQRAELERHLATCPDCQARLEGFRSVARVLETWDAPEVSPWFNARLRRRIAEWEGSSWNWRAVSQALLRPSYVVALAMVLMVGSLAVWNAAPAYKAPSTAPAQAHPVDDVARVAEDYDLLANFDVLPDLQKPGGSL